jgi:hypothetical protein
MPLASSQLKRVNIKNEDKAQNQTRNCQGILRRQIFTVSSLLAEASKSPKSEKANAKDQF